MSLKAGGQQLDKVALQERRPLQLRLLTVGGHCTCDPDPPPPPAERATPLKIKLIRTRSHPHMWFSGHWPKTVGTAGCVQNSRLGIITKLIGGQRNNWEGEGPGGARPGGRCLVLETIRGGSRGDLSLLASIKWTAHIGSQ